MTARCLALPLFALTVCVTGCASSPTQGSTEAVAPEIVDARLLQVVEFSVETLPSIEALEGRVNTDGESLVVLPEAPLLGMYCGGVRVAQEKDLPEVRVRVTGSNSSTVRDLMNAMSMKDEPLIIHLRFERAAPAAVPTNADAGR